MRGEAGVAASPAPWHIANSTLARRHAPLRTPETPQQNASGTPRGTAAHPCASTVRRCAPRKRPSKTHRALTLAHHHAVEELRVFAVHEGEYERRLAGRRRRAHRVRAQLQQPRRGPDAGLGGEAGVVAARAARRLDRQRAAGAGGGRGAVRELDDGRPLVALHLGLGCVCLFGAQALRRVLGPLGHAISLAAPALRARTGACRGGGRHVGRRGQGAAAAQRPWCSARPPPAPGCDRDRPHPECYSGSQRPPRPLSLAISMHAVARARTAGAGGALGPIRASLTECSSTGPEDVKITSDILATAGWAPNLVCVWIGWLLRRLGQL
jgi:hypothetical protein